MRVEDSDGTGRIGDRNLLDLASAGDRGRAEVGFTGTFLSHSATGAGAGAGTGAGTGAGAHAGADAMDVVEVEVEDADADVPQVIDSPHIKSNPSLAPLPASLGPVLQRLHQAVHAMQLPDVTDRDMLLALESAGGADVDLAVRMLASASGAGADR